MQEVIKHSSIDLLAVLRNSHGKLIDFIEDENGKLLNDRSAREYIKSLLDTGVKKICTYNDCKQFHPVTGCPGHPVEIKMNLPRNNQIEGHAQKKTQDLPEEKKDHEKAAS